MKQSFLPSRILKTAGLIALGSGLLAANAAPAQASGQQLAPSTSSTTESVTWSLTPSLAENNQERVSLRHDLDPGQSVDDQLVLTNHGDTDATFRVYASDGVITEEGQFDIRSASHQPEDSGAWIDFGDSIGPDSLVEVGAGQSTEIDLTINVPEDATPGDHPAGIVAAIGSSEAAAGQLAVESRVGARLHLKVNGEVQPVLSLDNVDSNFRGSWNPFVPGTVETSMTVTNTGNVRLGAVAETTLGGVFGLLESSSEQQTWRELLPGDSIELQLEQQRVWPLIWVGGQATLYPQVVGEDTHGQIMPVTESVWSLAIGWSQLALLLVIAGIIYLVVRGRKQRQTKREEELAAAVEKAREEARQELLQTK